LEYIVNNLKLHIQAKTIHNKYHILIQMQLKHQLRH